MSQFYDDLAQSVADMLGDPELSQQFTIKCKTVGAYNPALGKPGVTTATYTVMGVSLPISNAFGMPDGTLVLATDNRVLLSPQDTNGATYPAPQPGDTVTDAAGRLFRVVQSRPMEPAGTVVVNDMQVRA